MDSLERHLGIHGGQVESVAAAEEALMALLSTLEPPQQLAYEVTEGWSHRYFKIVAAGDPPDAANTLSVLSGLLYPDD